MPLCRGEGCCLPPILRDEIGCCEHDLVALRERIGRIQEQRAEAFAGRIEHHRLIRNEPCLSPDAEVVLLQDAGADPCWDRALEAHHNLPIRDTDELRVLLSIDGRRWALGCVPKPQRGSGTGPELEERPTRARRERADRFGRAHRNVPATNVCTQLRLERLEFHSLPRCTQEIGHCAPPSVECLQRTQNVAASANIHRRSGGPLGNRQPRRYCEIVSGHTRSTVSSCSSSLKTSGRKRVAETASNATCRGT